MSSYLELAETVLRLERRPLSARALLRRAYEHDLVPTHLYGQTQEKTLQARLSEDILHQRERSRFFRNSPGRFFLREFLSDSSVPPEYRREMRARRRTRDLLRNSALGVSKECVESLTDGSQMDPGATLEKLQDEHCYRYLNPREIDEEWALVWSIAVVRRRSKILTYRTGRYRDDRDSFAHKRSICFAGLVAEDDRTLFDWIGLGIVECALTAASTDLNVPIDQQNDPDNLGSMFLHEFKSLFKTYRKGRVELLALVEIIAPDWFEPAGPRLSINDLGWMDPCALNNISDFDPWSQVLLENVFGSKNAANRRQRLHSGT
ncbi:HB1, ASXL, restriction endonuclease HTH domain [Roseivivax halotolerans]|uniref:HB1, ASXL, restriction endonuclease HTH domain n=1 Tax=Roseivivax halotolerans TaxID=93684 RepID=A0A1I5W4Q2_9RHOB|nr:winged helix-turn-helix domain-containing protein [Roseivivax halotolerans]SFQ14718.1 HB1, ASXL, restriction endonuclease HTH domain [Roseivivax halotolerans]